MTYLLRLAACLLVLLSFNAKALVVNGCTIEPYAACPGGDLSFADLANADLNNANLSLAFLSDANLSGANLSYAELFETNLSYADLSSADLSFTYLSNANLTGADISNANFSNVTGSDYILNGAIYNEGTVLPSGIIPQRLGMIFVSEVPLPAGIYLFLSGLVGFVLMRVKRNKLIFNKSIT